MGGPCVGRPVRWKHELDRQVKQRAQRLDGLPARRALWQPVGREFETAAEVDEGFADDERLAALDPEHEVV